jgi:DNA-directed RNA polymerase subunit RPC12/RpoP
MSYVVKVLDRPSPQIEVICPVCGRNFKIKSYGVVKCPFCLSKLFYKEKK